MTVSYVANPWVDDDGSGTTGTPVSAARMNGLEAAAADASVRTIQVDVVSRYEVDDFTTGHGIDFDTIPGTVPLRVLLIAQTNTAQNGLYLYSPTQTPKLARLPEDALLDYGNLICVRQGQLWAGSIWQRINPAIAGQRKFAPCGGQSLEAFVGAAGQPAFLNAWVAGGSGGPRYYVSSGRCYVVGSVQGGATGSTVFTLPCAPAVSRYSIMLQDGGAAGAYTLVDTGGSVTAWRTATAVYMDFSFKIAIP